MSRVATVNAPSKARIEPEFVSPVRTLSLGWLAMLPMFVAYEFALLHFGGTRRNTGELVLGLALQPLGPHAALARWIGIFVVAALALVVALRRGASVLPSVARIVLEGLGFAVLLGPVLVLLSSALGHSLDVSWSASGAPRGMADAAMLFGGAAWEELFFRVGCYSFAYWLATRFWSALDGSAMLGRAIAEFVGLGSSACLFAVAHFERFTRWIGPGGRPWDLTAFTWYALAGLLLGLVFRWRGPGVAAWTHGAFNVALWIGVDPDVVR